MDRHFWRETRRSALILLLLFLTSGAMLVIGKARRGGNGYDPLSVGTMVANRLIQNEYYEQRDAANYSPDDYEMLQEVVQTLAEKKIYTSLILYEGNADTVRAVSGNYLSFSPEDATANPSRKDHSVYVALDYAADESIIDLIRHLHKSRITSVTGYLDGDVLYPTQVELEDSRQKMNWDTFEKERKTETRRLAFSPPDRFAQGEPIVLTARFQPEFVGNLDSYAAVKDLEGTGHAFHTFQQTAKLAQNADQQYRSATLEEFVIDGFGWSTNAIKNEYSLLDCVRPAEGGKPALYLSVNMVSYPLHDALCDYGIYLVVLFFFYLCVFIALLTRKFQAVYRAQSRAAQRQRDFTNALAHEMKTPLGVIRGYSELMQEGIAPEKHPVYLAGIIGETERMDAMVLQILSFSRIDTQHLPMHLSCFAIDWLIRKQIADFQPMMEKKGLALYTDVPEYLYVTADEKGITLVLRNFLSNAVKYAPPGKAVKLRAFSEKRRIVVEVFNQGEPVATKDMPYLWDAFYRADESRTRENGGSGMGLAIAKAVLDRHGARYGAYNKGGGVYFWFSLPG